MPYWIGYKVSATASNVIVASFSSLEKALQEFNHLRNTSELGEILIPPFFADTEEEAREEAKKLITD